MDALILAQGGPLSLPQIIRTIWLAVSGGAGGTDYVSLMQQAGLILTTTAAIFHFSRCAYRMALGETQHLVPDLVKYLAIFAVVSQWSDLAHWIYGLAENMANGFTADFQAQILTPLQESYQRQIEAQRYLDLSSLTGWLSALGNLASGPIYAFCSILSLVVMVGAVLYIMVSIAGVFVVLAFYLLIGPVFIALSMLQLFQQFVSRWIGVVVSLFIVVPMYGIGLAICATFTGLLAASVVSLAHNPLEQLFGSCLVPILQASVILSINKIVGQVTGGYFGSTGSLAAGVAAGLAAMASRSAPAGGGGGGAAGSGGGGGGGAMAASAAAGTASTAARSASSAAQAATSS